MDFELLQGRAQRAVHQSIWKLIHLRVKRMSGPFDQRVVRRDVPGHGWTWEYNSACFIENESGFIVDADGDLWSESLLPNFPTSKPLWRITVPSPFRIARQRAATPPKMLACEEVVSVRHLWEWNYYHFFMDVLPQLQVLEHAGHGGEYPVVIGRYALELPWTSEVLKMGSLADRHWIVQDEFLVSAKRVIGSKVSTPYGERMGYVQKLLDAPTPNPSARRRVFLVRARGSARSLLNHDEAISLLEDFGFEVVDTAGMTVADQQKLLSETRYLVALHGAGMVNMMFRHGAPMSVLELHGHSHVSEDFRLMAQAAGWYFSRLSGQAEGGDFRFARFTIDPSELRHSVELLLKS